MKGKNPEQKIHAISIRKMFDAIAPTYDLLNHLISFGFDIRWRKHAISLLKEKSNGIFLDIAAGSGDIVAELQELQPRNIVATDFSFNMLKLLQKKLGSKCKSLHIVSCDAHNLPFPSSTFDGAVVAFGIRNFSDKEKALREMYRVLNPNGIAIILELTVPRRILVRYLYKLYVNTILPLVGKIISRHNTAYEYLPDSINRFPEHEKFLEMMREAGFSIPTARELTLGTATIYVGHKFS